jgi:phosphopantothenoylcysteine decarboxylase/phosphopantothenate--cysteine ligase
MHTPLSGKRILLGVTGSIACYKAVDLASKLRQAGAEVDVILTGAAGKFVTPLTFQSVTGRRAYTDEDLWGAEGHVLHIGLAKEADLFVIAPATANTMAKLAHGSADNLLSLTALAAECPLLVAPAMDGGMYSNPATQANVLALEARGMRMIGPEEGHLASGLSTVGRMVEPLALRDHMRYVLSRDGPLAGKQALVTAGGTQEAIDPVRFIANRSSGKQGFALAQAALDLGADVTLIAGPVQLPTPVGALRVDVRSAEEMAAAVLEHVEQTDVLLMAAAVADFRPVDAATHKIKKGDGPPEIRLTQNQDILKEVLTAKGKSGWPRFTVGFAAESEDLLDNAAKKLKAKGLDMIVANDIIAEDAGFEVDTNLVTMLFADGSSRELALTSKAEVAGEVVAEAAKRLQGEV